MLMDFTSVQSKWTYALDKSINSQIQMYYEPKHSVIFPISMEFSILKQICFGHVKHWAIKKKCELVEKYGFKTFFFWGDKLLQFFSAVNWINWFIFTKCIQNIAKSKA